MKAKNLFAGLLTGALVLGMSTVSFAEVKQPTPDQAYLTKYLTVSDDVELATVDGLALNQYSFAFTKVTSDAPTVTNPVVTISHVDDENCAEGAISFADIFKDVTFPHAGEFVYTVAEVQASGASNNAITKTTTANGSTLEYTLSYGTDKYTARIYVKNGTNDGKTVPVIDKVTVETGENKTGAGVEANKVDPSDDTPHDDTTTPAQDPGSDTPPTPQPTPGSNGFCFKNTLVVKETNTTTDKPDPTDPEDPFTPVDPDKEFDMGIIGVGKIVKGAYGDKSYAFPFTVTVNKPAGVSTTVTTYTAKKVGLDASGEKAETPYTGTYGTALNVELKHGEYLAITEAYVGSEVTVSELLGNTDKCKVANRGSYQAQINNETKGAKGATVTSTNPVVIDENGADDQIVTNELDANDVTPTGIVMNNLPYILLVLIAACGMVVIGKRKKETIA